MEPLAFKNFVLFFLIGSAPCPAFAEYSYVVDERGLNLGMNYSSSSATYTGELAIHNETGALLFVECGTANTFFDESKMRRRNRNCSNNVSVWPDNLAEYVVAASPVPIVLTGPPATCGVCMPGVGDPFEIPDGVSVIPNDQLVEFFPGLDLERTDDRNLTPEAPLIFIDPMYIDGGIFSTHSAPNLNFSDGNGIGLPNSLSSPSQFNLGNFGTGGF
jgi:hypothetical protein